MSSVLLTYILLLTTTKHQVKLGEFVIVLQLITKMPSSP